MNIKVIDRDYRRAIKQAHQLSRGELLRLVVEELHSRWQTSRREAVYAGDVTQDGPPAPGPARK